MNILSSLTTRKAILGIMAVAVVALGAPAYARDDSEPESEHRNKVKTTTQTTENTSGRSGGVEDTQTTATEAKTEDKAAREARISAKREALQAKLQEKKQAIQQKLDDKRLKLCEKKQDTINKVISKSRTHGQGKLEKLQSAETRVREYYAAQNLSLANFDTLSTAIDDTEAAAVASVGVTGETNFVCTSDDATRPGGVISDTLHAQHDALKAYRQAIRDLIKAIKDAQPSTDDTAQTEGSN